LKRQGSAASTARALVAAEIDGQKGHGFSRVASYAAQLRSGKIAGTQVPTTEIRGARIDIDAGCGLAFPAIDLALDALPALARGNGVAMAAIRRSHHCGQLGAHVEKLAEAGCIALMVANTPKAMAPWGGNAALFGTNPIAFAAPRDGHPPLVIDLSLSKVARGKIMAAAKAGEAIPAGWALDADGNPTKPHPFRCRGCPPRCRPDDPRLRYRPRAGLRGAPRSTHRRHLVTKGHPVAWPEASGGTPCIAWRRLRDRPRAPDGGDRGHGRRLSLPDTPN
jgi:LDH2 family malate/lactate/ureidoglycolate dehydrogenase